MNEVADAPVVGPVLVIENEFDSFRDDWSRLDERCRVVAILDGPYCDWKDDGLD